MKDNKPNLKSAYALETVQDNLELYANWASDYENDFASSMDYILPNQVAQIFSDMGGKGPVLRRGGWHWIRRPGTCKARNRAD